MRKATSEKNIETFCDGSQSPTVPKVTGAGLKVPLCLAEQGVHLPGGAGLRALLRSRLDDATRILPMTQQWSVMSL